MVLHLHCFHFDIFTGRFKGCHVITNWSPIRVCMFFLNLGEFITPRFSFLKHQVLPCSFLALHCCIHWNFQLYPCFFESFFTFSIFQIDEMNASQPSSVIGFSLLHSPFLLLFDSERHYQSGSIPLAIHDLVWWKHIYPLGGVSFNKVNLVNPFHESDKLLFTSTFQ